ncbi:signal peptidase II [Polaromonas sp. CT11-55]|uniref:signal peptidase II n=1 Tax=Polaromonas sp. CT11-55 TaxID=3243045 RepID=UPI0039A71202
MSIVKRLLLVLFVLLSCVACDQSTKMYAEANLPKAQALSLLSDTVRLQVAHNEGAFLSLGASAPQPWRVAIFRAGVAAMLLALLAYTLLAKSSQGLFVFALALILSGGSSNLIDRFVNEGYVVDFINLGAGSLRTGIFNVADIAIVVGAFLLSVQSWRGRHSKA